MRAAFQPKTHSDEPLKSQAGREGTEERGSKRKGEERGVIRNSKVGSSEPVLSVDGPTNNSAICVIAQNPNVRRARRRRARITRADIAVDMGSLNVGQEW